MTCWLATWLAHQSPDRCPPYRQRSPNFEHGRVPRPSGSMLVEPAAGNHADIPRDGRVHPQIATTGVPTAAATCIMPVSADSVALDVRIVCADSAKLSCPTRLMMCGFSWRSVSASMVSDGPPINVMGACGKDAITAFKRPMGMRFPSCVAPMAMHKPLLCFVLESTQIGGHAVGVWAPKAAKVSV